MIHWTCMTMVADVSLEMELLQYLYHTVYNFGHIDLING